MCFLGTRETRINTVPAFEDSCGSKVVTCRRQVERGNAQQKERASRGWEGHGGREISEPESKHMNKHVAGKREGTHCRMAVQMWTPMCFPLSWHFSFSASISLTESPVAQQLLNLISEETLHRLASGGNKNSSSQKHDQTHTQQSTSTLTDRRFREQLSNDNTFTERTWHMAESG